jgi:hypothetical protein
VDIVPDLLSGSTGNRTRTSGSVARNSDHWTTEAVRFATVLQHLPGSIVSIQEIQNAAWFRSGYDFPT